MTVRPIETSDVAGFLHEPVGQPVAGLALTHGIGGNCREPRLAAMAEGLCQAGVMVVRFDLASSRASHSGPTNPAVELTDRETLEAASALLRAMVSGPVLLGGNSYGARQASLLAAAKPASADGLLLLAYPLHPPDEPGQLRTVHWPQIHVPALFVHGTQDPYGSIDVLRNALGLIGAPSKLVTLEGADHKLMDGRFDVGTVVIPAMRALQMLPSDA